MKKSVLALLAAIALLAALPAQATKQAQERRDARDGVAMATPLLPALCEYPDGAGHGAGAAGMWARDALPAASPCLSGWIPGPMAWSSPAPAIRPAPCCGRELAAIARWCHANGVRLISDEIYHGLSWGSVAESSAAGFSESAVIVNSFSKYPVA